jgi:hypothetical protein
VEINQLAIFDIKKQELVGKTLKFIDSEENDIENFEIMIVPEEKKKKSKFF